MIAEIVSTKKKVEEIPSNKKNTYWDSNRLYTLEEYFELEEKAPFKSEFVNGKVIPMAGGTIAHSRIGGNIFGLLFMLFYQLDNTFEVFNSDQKIYISAYNRSVYPDTCVVIGEPEMHNDGNKAIVNPALIFEVASKSTGRYDRIGKFRMYQTLPSFKEYVLIDQETPVVDVFFKIKDNEWRMKSYIGLEAEVTLETIDCTLKMSDIYKKVKDLKDPQAIIEFPEDEE